jgi:hypothetical protein
MSNAPNMLQGPTDSVLTIVIPILLYSACKAVALLQDGINNLSLIFLIRATVNTSERDQDGG